MPFCWSLCSFNYPMGNGATISIICVLLMSSSVNFSENIVIHMKYNKKLKPNITHLSHRVHLRLDGRLQATLAVFFLDKATCNHKKKC